MNEYKYEKAVINAEKLDAFLNNIGFSKSAIIYGAGNNGIMVAQHLLRIGASLKCFVDANKDIQGDCPFFVNIISPRAMKDDYSGEPIIITPYIGGDIIEEFLLLADFPEDKVYLLEFDLAEFGFALPDVERHKPLELQYANVTPINPAITVLMLCYNTPEHYLRRAIESVLSQTFENFEYFMIDHGSNDGITSRILHEYAALDKRIKIFRTDINFEIERQQGRDSSKFKSTLFNDIKKRISTEYMCWIDSDDTYAEDFLELTYTAMLSHEADLVCVQYIAYQEDDYENRKYLWHPILSKEIFAKTAKDKWLAFCETRMPEGGWSVLSKTDIYLNALKVSFDEPNGLTTDKMSSFEMLKSSGRVVFIGKPLYTLTSRASSSVGGSKSHDWRYMLMWYRWMICGWLRETRETFDYLGLDANKYSYPLAQFIVEFVYSMSDRLVNYVQAKELAEFNLKLKTLMSDNCFSRVIESRKFYREMYAELEKRFLDMGENE